MTKSAKVQDLYNYYKMRIQELQEEIIQATYKLHPQINQLIAKVDLPNNVPIDKRKKILNKVSKRIEKEYGETPWIIEDTRIIEDTEKFIKQTKEKGEYRNKHEFERFQRIMKGMDSIFFNPYDLIYGFFKMGIIVAFVFFEAFNNELINIIDELPDDDKYKDRSVHNIKTHLRNEMNRLLRIKIETEFEYWEYLIYYHYLRQILVHRDGKIDEDYINKVKELKIKLPEYEKGAIVLVDQRLFISVTRLILLYINFIFEKSNMVLL